MSVIKPRSATRNLAWDSRLDDGGKWTYQEIYVALLMDIRDELLALNGKLTGVGPTVHQIERNTRYVVPRLCDTCGHGPYRRASALERHKERKHPKKKRVTA